ncbi:type VII secretion target [Mycobacterium sp. 21AC1]|uniref:type VII secretion target n=1 Tax=[Mycobacterium] appelbergii TaxID=2939269 RepID=UPI00293941A8|nr:type VII secretion target [Mycobacterium sp. 21AC1]MDV3125716.1 type VII secretion target [Mycobacterium sp. 21AC1]
MSAYVRVKPESLRTAAHAEAQVGDQVSRTDAGTATAVGATGMSGLRSGAACQFAGTTLDEAATRAGAELAAHSKNLLGAAGRYEQVDSAFGERLSQIAGSK